MGDPTRPSDQNTYASLSTHPSSHDDRRSSTPDLGNTFPTLDSQIDHKASIAYWSAVPATIDGMLGGHPQVSRIDLRGSKNFVRKVQRLSRLNGENSTTASSSDAPTSKMDRILEGGAGIGRITSGLLIHIATEVDIVEPVTKFAQVVIDSDMKRDGQVGEVFVQGLETFMPQQGRKYDLVWNQWCLGHLTDQQVVEWLERAKKCLKGYGDDAEEKQNGRDVSEQKGWIMVKENLSTDMLDKDIFDDLDSAVTRTDNSFRRIFEKAGLNIVKMEIQSGFPRSLCPVKMYALRPK